MEPKVKMKIMGCIARVMIRMILAYGDRTGRRRIETARIVMG